MKSKFERLRKWIAERKVRQQREELLRRQGFLVYCECKAVLNEHPAVGDEEGLCTWFCEPCSKMSTFDLRHPVPLFVGRLGVTGYVRKD